MKRILSLSLAVAATFAASAGTREPLPPAPAVSAVDVSLDTLLGGTSLAAEAVTLDTVLSGWDWSPWPGIYLNTKPCRGFFFAIR